MMKKGFVIDLIAVAITISLTAACSNGEAEKVDVEPKNEVAKKKYTKLPVTREEFVKMYLMNKEPDAFDILTNKTIYEEKRGKYYSVSLNSSDLTGAEDEYTFDMLLNKDRSL